MVQQRADIQAAYGEQNLIFLQHLSLSTLPSFGHLFRLGVGEGFIGVTLGGAIVGVAPSLLPESFLGSLQPTSDLLFKTVAATVRLIVLGSAKRKVKKKEDNLNEI